MEGFQPPRNLLFSVFTAEIQCFLRFHEVRRGMLFGMNFKQFFQHFGIILVVQNSYFFVILLRSARPPTQFARSVFLRTLHSRSVLRQRHHPPNPTPRDPPRDPRGEGALRAPWASSGPRGGRLYATKAIPNGIDLLRRLLYE